MHGHVGKVDDVTRQRRCIKGTVGVGKKLFRECRFLRQLGDAIARDIIRKQSRKARFEDDRELDRLATDIDHCADAIHVHACFAPHGHGVAQQPMQAMFGHDFPNDAVAVAIGAQEIDILRLPIFREFEDRTRSTAEIAGIGAEELGVQVEQQLLHESMEGPAIGDGGIRH